MLKVSLSTEIEREDEAEKEREITKWTSEEIQKYDDSLKKAGKAVKWKDLRSKISNAIPKKKIAAKDSPEEKRWWDEECHVAKKELKEVKRNYREDKAMKCQYLTKRKKIQESIRKKEDNLQRKRVDRC